MSTLASQAVAPPTPALSVGRSALIAVIGFLTLVDLFAGFDWARYNVELFATNLFDERTELTRAVACSICTNTRIYVGRPRTVGLRLGTKF